MPQPLKTIFTNEEFTRFKRELMSEALGYRTAEKRGARIDAQSGNLLKLLQGERFVRELAQRKSALLIDKNELHNAGIVFSHFSGLLSAIKQFKGIKQAAGLDVDIPVVMDPYLEEFWKAYHNFHGINFGDIQYPDTPDSINNDLAAAFKQFKSCLKQQCFLKAARARRTHSNSRYAAVLGHYEYLLQAYSELNVIKLGMAYSPQTKLFDADSREAYEGLRNPFNRFMNQHVHQSASGQVAGYLWKLDLIGQRGYCFHLIIFADPRYTPPLEECRQHLEDSWLCMKPMQQANDQISKAQGSEFQLASVSDPSQDVMQAALQSSTTEATIPSKYDGRLSAERPEKVAQIKQLLTDWVKFDRLMSLGLPSKHRTFGKSQISRKIGE